MKHFKYGKKEIDYLRSKDPKLKEVIDEVGHIYRGMDDDLFSSVVHHIVGQQISSSAQKTIWKRLEDTLKEVTPNSVHKASRETLQSCGLTFKKVDYIKEFAQKVVDGSFDLEEIERLDDKDAIEKLSSLRGIGVWTAEMILLFCLGRKDILAYDDLAIQRGLRMIYHHRKIDRKLFSKYKRRYSPYGSIASLYIWKVSSGALPGMKDYAPKVKRK